MRITDGPDRGMSAEPVFVVLDLDSAGGTRVAETDRPLFFEQSAAGGSYRVDGDREDALLRVRLETTGFSRVFSTTGSLGAAYGDKSSTTTSEYSIPPGPIVLSGSVQRMRSTKELFITDGLVSTTQQIGLFGAAAKTLRAGSFKARQILDDPELET